MTASRPSPPLLIVWHSRTGTSRQLAEAAGEGAGDGALAIGCEAAEPGHFLAARGVLFVCPENLAGLSGAMKEMFDRCYYPLLGQIEGRAYATIIAAGSDGTGAQRQLDRICTGWRLRRVAEGVIVGTGAQTPERILAPKTVTPADLAMARQLGAGLAEALRQGIY